MLQPIYLQDYKVDSEQGNVNYSVVGALPNEMPGVETKQYTWNFVSHMVLDKCSRLIRIKYDFKDTEFQKEITFEDKLTGTIQLGSKVYNAGDIMSYKYDKELLEMEVTILFPVDEKICGKNLSWNIFINDLVSCPTNTITIDLKNNDSDSDETEKYSWSFGFAGNAVLQEDSNPSCSSYDANQYATYKLTIKIKDNIGAYNFSVINSPTTVSQVTSQGNIDLLVFLLPITITANSSCSNVTANWVVNGQNITCGPAKSNSEVLFK